MPIGNKLGNSYKSQTEMKKITVNMLAVSIMTLFMMVSCQEKSEYYRYENKIKEFDGTAYDYLLSQQDVYDSLLMVLDRLPPLKDTLMTKRVTLFAITNKSFDNAIKDLNIRRAISNKQPIYLRDIDLQSLDTIMCRYIINGRLTTDSVEKLVDGMFIPSLKYNYKMHTQYRQLNASGFVNGGQQQLVFTDPNESIFERYWESVPTNSVNISARNSMIHVLAPAHNFGFNKLGR